MIAVALSRIPWGLKSQGGEIVSEPSLEYHLSSTESESEQPAWMSFEVENPENPEDKQNFE